MLFSYTATRWVHYSHYGYQMPKRIISTQLKLKMEPRSSLSISKHEMIKHALGIQKGRRMGGTINSVVKAPLTSSLFFKKKPKILLPLLFRVEWLYTMYSTCKIRSSTLFTLLPNCKYEYKGEDIVYCVCMECT